MAVVVYVNSRGTVDDMTLIDAVDTTTEQRPSKLNDTMAKCLGSEIMRWTFPPTTWQGEVQIVHPPIFFARWGPRPRSASSPAEEKDAVGAVMKQHDGEVKGCYDAYLARGAPSGDTLRVVVQFVILASGITSGVVVAEPPKLEARFEQCFVGVLRKMTFGETANGKSLVVTYPYRFSP